MQRFYSDEPQNEKRKEAVSREILTAVLKHQLEPSLNFYSMSNSTRLLVFRRYGEIYFTAVIDQDDNCLLALEVLHKFYCILDTLMVEGLKEKDFYHSIDMVYMAADELFLTGKIHESSSHEICNFVTGNRETERIEVIKQTLEEQGF